MNQLHKRQFIIGGAASVAASICAGPAAGQSKPALRRTADNWMREWMQNAKDVQGGLFVSRFADPVYFLTKPISWKPDPGQEAHRPVTVPVGFVTDFASIPRVFWQILRPDGEYAYAAVIHDYLYWLQDRSREQADAVFKLVMHEFNISRSKIVAIHGAVRVGGGGPWRDTIRLKGKGEKRILAQFPNDPRIRWEEWKKRPGVFA